MDPYQNQGLFPNTPAPGAADLSSVQGTALANAPNQFTDVQYKAPPGVIAVPFGQEHPGRAYTRWAGQAVEVSQNSYWRFFQVSELNADIICHVDQRQPLLRAHLPL